MLGWCLLAAPIGSCGFCSAAPIPQQTGSDTSQNAGDSETSPQDAGLSSGSPALPQAPGEYNNSLGKPMLKAFVSDQKGIWTSPFHVKLVDAEWLVGLGGAAAIMFATDTEASKHL